MTSRIPGFYKLSFNERQLRIAEAVGIDPERLIALSHNGGMTMELADHMVENAVTSLALPMGVALNFCINGQDVLVPMAIEEPSVVAAASNAARLIRDGGGFVAESDPPLMIAQVELRDVGNLEAARTALLEHKATILARCDAAQPGLKRRGGGAQDVEVRLLEAKALVVHLIVDCRDAMGANAVNTIAERVAPYLATLAQARVGLRILSNLADRRCVTVKASVPIVALEMPEEGISGAVARDLIIQASRFAELDAYRAATHNKGIMNGVDAVALAAGQDWRSLEAGAHAYAAKDGHYSPLARWQQGADGSLEGVLKMPMAVGTVGGAVTVHPAAVLAMEVMGKPDAARLGQILGAAGLASNLAALRALATVGIQRGHMSLHQRRLDFHQDEPA